MIWWPTSATLLLNQTCPTTRTGKIVVREKILCCANVAQHNFFDVQHNIFHVQQFSQFVLLDMFDSKVVWHLWATILLAVNDVSTRTMRSVQVSKNVKK